MRRIGLASGSLFLAASYAWGQQVEPPAQPGKVTAESTWVQVYTPGANVIPPGLLSLSLPPIPDEKCNAKQDGKVTLSTLVDAAGRPRNTMFLQALGTDVDRLALRIIATDRFSAGTVSGKPAVMPVSITVNIQSCLVESADANGKPSYKLRLRSWPVQKLVAPPEYSGRVVLTSDEESWRDAQRVYQIGHGVSAPVVLNHVEAQYTDAARRAHFSGICKLTIIVDAHGLPETIEIVKHLEYGMDGEAVSAANSYRFRPAIKDYEPVAVKINVDVNFRMQ
jgi:outer membrane biosynthesis protein TonB